MTMRPGRSRVATSLATFAMLAGMLLANTGVVAAAPKDPLINHFTNCSGPPGTPTEFDAVRVSSAPTGRPVDGTSQVRALQFVDAETGEIVFTTPGLEHSNVPTITCLLLNHFRLRWEWVTMIVTGSAFESH
jgi:hypothetical protein